MINFFKKSSWNFLFYLAAVVAFFALTFFYFTKKQPPLTESIEEFEILGEDQNDINESEMTPEELAKNWKRPEGPLRVGLQAGHWKNDELPDELSNLRQRGGGTKGGGKQEWEVNLAIAEETKKILEPKGITVDILPATIPADYWADVFIAIHADGSESYRASGYKVAAPRRDLTGNAQTLAALLEKAYGAKTNLTPDQNITPNMRGYYAFNWRRYEHSIHPMTPAIILETGFLTNWSDAKLLINNPSLPAEGIAEAILTFLQNR